MKMKWSILACLALLVASNAVAGEVIETRPLLKFIKGATTDSTSISLPNGSPQDCTTCTNPANADPDTTDWVNLKGINFPPCSFDGQPLMRVLVTAANAGAGDSVAVVVQYSPDKVLIVSKTLQSFIASVAGTVNAVECQDAGNEAAFGVQWIRFILADHDSGSKAWTGVSIRPVYNWQR